MNGEEDSSSKCREARRRRSEMRRMASVVTGEAPAIGIKREADTPDLQTSTKRSGVPESDPPPSEGTSSSRPSSSPGGGGAGGGASVPASLSVASAGSDPPVSFGSLALLGRSREMEDAVAVQPGFYTPAGGSAFHFFAVFDGHGGSHVSKLCMERMHVLLAEELARGLPAGAEEEDVLTSAAMASFARMDELALTSCACGRVSDPRCGCDRSGFESDIVGSTAVAAVVGPRRVLVANCGDSRAVLCRGGTAIPMSIDHKPDSPDELARIEAAGGRVIYLNGARVGGILAVSRAIGDKYFKPVVISEPEICIVDRHPQDECLIIGSDGLWDVVPNDLACEVARRCLMEGSPRWGAGESRAGASENTSGDIQGQPDSRCSLAANFLARLALRRKSADNISVIVVDLRSG